MITYRCVQGDMLDLICRRHYGAGGEAVVTQVLEVNPGLAALGPRLPAGTLVALPQLTPPPDHNSVQLWD